MFCPTPYLDEEWHYKDAKTEFIKRSIRMFDWENTNVNEKVQLFSKTILNILNNFIQHETIVCNDGNPPWFKMKEKTTAYEYFRQISDDIYRQHCLKFLQDGLNNSIKFSKGKYYNRMASKLRNTKNIFQ